jgi:hypothetical protein
MFVYQWLSILLITWLLLVTSGCASLPENTGRQASHAFADTADTTIGASAVEKSGQKETGRTVSCC